MSITLPIRVTIASLVALVTLLAAVLAFTAPVFANNGNGQGNTLERGNHLRAVAEPVELQPGDVTLHKLNGVDYVRVQHNIAEDYDGYITLVQREPARTGGQNVVTEDPGQFNAAWLGILGPEGPGVNHKGQLNWYYEANHEDAEWVSLTFQFNGKGELLHVNGVVPQ